MVPFGCLTKLGAKRAEVVQKFVPWSRVRIFRNEHTHPPYWTQNSCFIVFYTIFVQLAPFGCVTKLSAKRANLMRKFVPRSRSEFFAMNAPDPPLWTLNWRFAMFRTIWMHLGPFGCLTKLGAKWAELVQKFVPRSRIGIFGNERTRSTPLDPKLMF